MLLSGLLYPLLPVLDLPLLPLALIFAPVLDDFVGLSKSSSFRRPSHSDAFACFHISDTFGWTSFSIALASSS